MQEQDQTLHTIYNHSAGLMPRNHYCMAYSLIHVRNVRLFYPALIQASVYQIGAAMFVNINSVLLTGILWYPPLH